MQSSEEVQNKGQIAILSGGGGLRGMIRAELRGDHLQTNTSESAGIRYKEEGEYLPHRKTSMML